MKWNGILVGLVMWVTGNAVMAQGPHPGSPTITNFGAEQYKAHDQNWSAVQDPRGVLYFANNDGILEFDGQRWQLFKVPNESAVRSLAVGSDGTVFFGAIGDLGYLAVTASGKVTAVSLKAEIPEAERSFSDVIQVASCSDGIYFLTRERIFRFHAGRISVIPYKLGSCQPCIMDGTLFLADANQGFCLMDGDQVVPVPQLAGLYNGKRIVIAPFGQHELLVGRVTGDFRRVDLSALWDEAAQRYITTRTAPKDLLRPFPTEVDHLMNASRPLLYKLVSLGQKGFAIASTQAGIIILDRDGHITNAIDKQDGLLDNAVVNLLVDRADNLWATTTSGICHVEVGVSQTTLGAANGLEGVPLSVGFHQGRMYVGTFQGLFVQAPYRYVPQNGAPRYVRVQHGSHEVWQFMEVDGDLLAACNGGLFQIKGESASLVPGTTDLVGMCLGVSRSWPGHVFMGGMGGVEVFKRAAGRWTRIGKLDGVKGNIRTITEDAEGDLWLGTDIKGVMRIHLNSDRPTSANIHGYGLEQGLPELRDPNLFIQGTTLIVGSSKGLFQATVTPWSGTGPDGIRFAPDLSWGRAFGELSSPITSIRPDGKGGYLFTTDKGLIWAAPGEGGQFHLNAKPLKGLPTLALRRCLILGDSVWLPWKQVYRMGLANTREAEQPFNVLIRKVTTRALRALFEGTHGREGSLLKTRQTVFGRVEESGEGPTLPFRENALSFEFSATCFVKPGATQFQYLLEGFDRDWSDWGSATTKEYSYLPEGSYRFRVRAKNIFGTLGQETEYRFRILPPWYRTLWARLLWTVLFALALAGLIYAKTRKLRRQKQALEAMVALRTTELEQVNRRLYDLNDEKNRIIGVAAHDLRNPLSIILLACELMEDGSETGKVQRFSKQVAREGRKMQELIQGLLDINAIEAQLADRPSLTEMDPKPVIESVVVAFAVRAKNKDIALDLDLGPDGRFIFADGQHFERVMANLVSNAVKYSPSHTRILICRETAAEYSVFRVKDQGPGLSAEDQARLFQSYARLSAKPTAGESSVGLGLSIVKKLVEGMGGQVWAESEPGQGATFSVLLPHTSQTV